MPLYEFRCPACARRTTVFVRRIGAPLAPRCEHCGAASLERLVSPFAQHKTLRTKLDELDPKYDKLLDAVDNVRGDDPLDRLARHPRNRDAAQG